jgi:hypothetical protein
MISDYLKAKLATEIPGILAATSHLEGGRQVVRINGASAIVGPFASDNEVEAAIRLALNIPKQEVVVSEPDQTEPTEVSHVTALPAAVSLTEASPRPRPAPARGGFAASLRAIMDDARAGLAQAREAGIAQVHDAVGELHSAKHAVIHVTGKMAQTIKDEASDIRAELGQISNDLGE